MSAIYRRPGRIFNRWGAAGIAAGIALALLWPAAIYFKGAWGEWYRFFVLRENLGKFAQQAYSVSQMLPYILQYFFPWSFLLICGVAVLFRRGAITSLKYIYPLLWMLCATAVFTVPAVKLPWYMLPSLPAAALFTAGAWVELSRSRVAKVGSVLTAVPVLVLLAALLIALRVSATPGLLIVLAAAFAAGLMLLYFLFAGDALKSTLAYGAMSVLVILAGGCFTFDRFPAEAVPMMSERSIPAAVVNQQIYLHSYYLDRPVAQIRDASQVNYLLSRGGRVVVCAHDLAEFSRQGGVREFDTLYTWRSWKEVIAPGEAVRAVITGDTLPLQEEVYIIESRRYGARPGSHSQGRREAAALSRGGR
jgi:hypothetical protein